MDLSSVKPRALVVDDAPEILHVLTETLKGEYAVVAATTGEKALELVAKTPYPSVILLDVMLPGIDGFEVCRCIKESHALKDIPVLFVSAVTETMDKVKGFELGGVDYITKPIQPEEVRARVNTHVRLYQLQRDYLLAKLAAEKASTAKSSFLSAVSHDLRSPLGIILGSADLLQQSELGPMNDQQRENLNRVIESGNVLLQRVNDIIDFTQIDVDESDLHFESLDATEQVNAILSSFQTAALHKGIKVKVISEAGLPPIWADRLRCRQILMNLIDNAVKHTPNGGSVTIGVEMAENHRCRFSISDNGPGLPASVSDALFTDQHLTDLLREAAHTGKGIGLATCRRYVLLHSGEIGVSSKLGQGSTFWFTIPLADKAACPVVPASQQRPPLPVDGKRFLGRKALIIDADMQCQNILETMLSMEGLKVAATPSVGDACRRFAAQHFDVIFSDLVTPGVNGADAVPTLRKHFRQKDLPIIITSSISDNRVVRTCIAQGVQDYLIKPLRRELLIPRLELLFRQGK
ncbi:MAG: hypothetical protein AMXMBFR84_43680 [Candidatus Hydrogenedentota bacterium]